MALEDDRADAGHAPHQLLASGAFVIENFCKMMIASEAGNVLNKAAHQ